MSDFEERARKAAEAVRQQIDTNPVDANLKRAQRPRTSRPVAGALALLVVAFGVTYGIGRNGTDSDTVTHGPFAFASALTPFDKCDAALDYFKQHGSEYLKGYPQVASAEGNASGPHALPGGSSSSGPKDIVVAPSRQSLPGGSSTSEASADTYSGTNIQEQGVDEPDMVKTNGSLIAIAAHNGVRIVTIKDGKAELRSTISVAQDNKPQGQFYNGRPELLLSGSRLAVIASTSGGIRAEANVKLWDLADAAAPKLLQALTFDGSVVDARLVGSRVRIVTKFAPDPDFTSPTYLDNGERDPASQQRLDSEIAKSRIEDWTPSYRLADATGKQVAAGPVVDCSRLSRPAEFAGLETVGVASFGMSNEMSLERAAGVVASGQTVYATTDSVYATSTKWSPGSAATTTDVHKFSFDKDSNPSYSGSGVVSGALLGQYAMSEHDGVLRVASTISEQRGWITRRQRTEGVVTTLKVSDGRLAELGRVEGLGRQANESIRGVRFLGDKGYVVTFRQTDPLFVIDLKDPSQPKVAGELKVPGYSGYLHPIGENLLLGVGQSGNEAGVAQPSKAESADAEIVLPAPQGQPQIQFSLFDVSDPANPKRVDNETYGQGAAAVEHDPRAFLYWAPKNLVIAPLQTWETENYASSVVLRIDGQRLERVGSVSGIPAGRGPISPPTYSDVMPINRSFIIGNDILSVSESTLFVNDLDSLIRRQELALGN